MFGKVADKFAYYGYHIASRISTLASEGILFLTGDLLLKSNRYVLIMYTSTYLIFKNYFIQNFPHRHKYRQRQKQATLLSTVTV